MPRRTCEVLVLLVIRPIRRLSACISVVIAAREGLPCCLCSVENRCGHALMLIDVWFAGW